MKQIQIKVRRGQSGWGASFNPSRKKSTRISVPRNYNTFHRKWVCSDSNAHHNPSYYEELEEIQERDRIKREEIDRKERIQMEKEEKIKKEKQNLQERIRVELLERFHSPESLEVNKFLRSIHKMEQVNNILDDIFNNFKQKFKTESYQEIVLKILRKTKVSINYSGRIQYSTLSKKHIKDLIQNLSTITDNRGWPSIALFILFGIGVTDALFKKGVSDGGQIVALGIIYLLYIQYRKRFTDYGKIYYLIKKLSKTINKNVDKSELTTSAIEMVYLNNSLKKELFFNDCMDSIFDKDIVGNVAYRSSHYYNKRKESGIDVADKKLFKPGELTLLKELYENDDFFDICVIILMLSVASTNGNIGANESFTIFTKFDLSDKSKNILDNALKIKNIEDLIVKLLGKVYKGNNIVFEILINDLLVVAESDDIVTDKEVLKITSIGDKLGLEKITLEKIIKSGSSQKTEVNSKSNKSSKNDSLFGEIDYIEFEELFGDEFT